MTGKRFSQPRKKSGHPARMSNWGSLSNVRRTVGGSVNLEQYVVCASKVLSQINECTGSERGQNPSMAADTVDVSGIAREWRKSFTCTPEKKQNECTVRNLEGLQHT